MKSEKEKQLEIAYLTEKLQRISGKKVVLEGVEGLTFDTPDIKILLDELTKNGIGFDDSFIRQASHGKTEGYYIRVHSIGKERLFDWSEQDIAKIKAILSSVNEKTEKYTLVSMRFADFDEEPGERTWPASFSFEAVEK